MTRKPYTEAEQRYLCANAMTLSLQEMADCLGRTEKSVRSFFNKRRISTRKNTYSAEEISYIKENAGVLPWHEIAAHLGRSENALYVYASAHGMAGSYTHPRARRVSTTDIPAVPCGGLHCTKTVESPVRVRQQFCSESCYMSAYSLRKYNLTKERWWEIFAAQGYACLCGATEVSSRGGWHVDHDHSCCSKGGSCGSCVRGILCGNCNLTLGNAKDSPATLTALADYLTRWSSSKKDKAVFDSIVTEI